MNQYIVLGLILLALVGWGTYEHNRFLTTKAEYGEFIAQSEKLASDQKAKIIQMEKDHAEKLHVVELARLAALDQLRVNQERARASRVSITPKGSERFCFSRNGFDAALQSFLGTVEGLIAEGDIALIDKQTLLKAWP